MICIKTNIPKDICEIDDELKAIYHSTDTICVWVFKSRIDRNKFMDETVGMLKKDRENHYILNYQFNSEGRIFRAEAFYKDYDNLIKYDDEFTDFDTNFSNDGYGFAKGIDLFWRDNKSIKNTDYWISYSYLDSKRDFKN